MDDLPATTRFSTLAKVGLGVSAGSALVDVWSIAILISAVQHPYEPGGSIGALLVGMAGSGAGLLGALVTWLAGHWRGPGERLSGQLNLGSAALGMLTVVAVCAR